MTAPFPIFVRGVTTAGEAFAYDTLLENISGGGAYLVLPQAVDAGAELLLVVCFAERDDMPVPRVALRGSVVRTEPQPDGGRGVAVAFTQHRFL